MKLLNYLGLFGRAYRATRREIGTSLVILVIISLIFTTSLWLAESVHNDEYTFGDALVWVVVKYVEDPADVVTPPDTVFGQVVGTLVGILGIAIFAVPAGLIGSGLLDAMSEEKEKDKVDKNSRSLHKRFRRIVQSASNYITEKGIKRSFTHVPRSRSFAHITFKTGMTEDEIIAAVNNCPDMRLMNLAMTKRGREGAIDDLVVVHFPLNTEYGCCLDRGSDVTIVAPAALTEPGTGNFAFSLAAMGGFNYVSRELTPNPDDPFGFYTMQKSKLQYIEEYDLKEDVESQALHFIDDLKRLRDNSEKAGRSHWFIFLLATTKSGDNQLNLWRLATDMAEKCPPIIVDDTRYGSTIKTADEAHLQQIVVALGERLATHTIETVGGLQPLAVKLDDNAIYKSVAKSNIMCRMGGGVECNAITLRLGYELLFYYNQHLLVAKDIADAVKGVVEPQREISERAQRCFLAEGDGYADDYCRSVEFESDPEKLEEMIAKQSKIARERFEHLDLDGNEEAPLSKYRVFERLKSVFVRG